MYSILIVDKVSVFYSECQQALACGPTIARRQSPIQDEYIEKYLAEKLLDPTATFDGADKVYTRDLFSRD